MTSSTRQTLRLSVGPKDGRRSEVWRVWHSDRDVFVSVRHLGGVLKMTLHYPTPERPAPLFYWGNTRRAAEREITHRPVTIEDRLATSWTGWEFHPGYSFDARIRIPSSELRELDTRNDGPGLITRVDPAPPLGFAVEFAVMSGPPHHTGLRPTPDKGSIEYLYEAQLASGRWIWIVAQTIPSPSDAELNSLRECIKADPGFKPASNPTRAARLIAHAKMPDGCDAWVELAGKRAR